MTNHIAESLSCFNNVALTKKQWSIILEGCGCPKSSHFWSALRTYCLIKRGFTYTLVDMNLEMYDKVLSFYKRTNSLLVKRSYDKAKAKKKARERVLLSQKLTFYVIDGVLCTEKPERD